MVIFVTLLHLLLCITHVIPIPAWAILLASKLCTIVKKSPSILKFSTYPAKRKHKQRSSYIRIYEQLHVSIKISRYKLNNMQLLRLLRALSTCVYRTYIFHILLVNVAISDSFIAVCIDLSTKILQT